MKRSIDLNSFFEEIKIIEDMFDHKEWKDLDAKYVKGFKDCLEVVTRKSMEISFDSIKVESKQVH